MESKNIGSLHVNITGDDSDLEKALNNSEKELKQATKSVREFGTNIGTLRAEFKKLSKEDFAGKTPEQIQAIENRLAELTDQIGDYDARIKSLSADPFQKVSGAVRDMSTMLAGAAGAATLFGGSEERMNELMQKTIGLIAIAEAAQTAADFTKQNAVGIYIKDKYREIAARIKEGLVIKANTASTVAETGAKTGLSGIQKALIVLQNAWNKAVMASPIMWIIGAIALLVTGVALLVKSYKKNNEAISKANKILETHKQRLKDINDTYEFRLEILKAQGKSDKEVNDEAIKQAQERLLYLRGEIDLINNRTKKYKNIKRIRETYGSLKNAVKQLKVYEKEFTEVSEKYIKLQKESYLINTRLAAEETAKKNEELKKQEEARKKALEEEEKARKEALAKQQRDYEAFLQSIYNKGYQEQKKISLGIEVDMEMPSAEELFGDIDDTIAPIIDKYRDITEIVGEAVTQGVADMGAGISESIGQLAAGAGGMGDVFKSLGNSVADFSTSLGKALIAAGIGAIAFKKLLLSPGAAIAAGAGLIAVGAFIRAKLASGPSSSGGGGSYASSGGTTGTAVAEGGTIDRTIFANPREGSLVGTLRAEGNELVAAVYYENKRTGN